MAEISYTKTNWVNNVTKLNADNMNHIENGIEAIDIALGTKLSQSDIVQTTGQSTTAVMSQKAVTDEIDALKGDLVDIQNEVLDVSEEVVEAELTYEYGYYSHVVGNKAIYTEDSSRASATMNAESGAEYKVTTRTGTYLVCGAMFVDSDNTILSVHMVGTGSVKDYVDESIIAPEGTSKLIVGTSDSRAQYLPKIKYTVNQRTFKSYTKDESNLLYADKSVEASIESINKTIYKYGVKWQINNGDDLGQRCFDAVGKNASISIGNEAGHSDFDTLFPWSDIKRCNIKINSNGAKIVTFEGESGFSLDGSNGDVFVRIPKFGYERIIENNYEYRIISSDALPHPVFVENGKVLDEIFVSCYEGYSDGQKLHSISGVIPTSNLAGSQFLNLAKANGKGYTLYDMRTIDAVWNLFAIEFGCRNTNHIFGYGLSDFYQAINSRLSKLTESDTNRIVIDKASAGMLACMPVGSNMLICKGSQQNVIKEAKILQINNTDTTTEFVFDGDGVDIDTTCFCGSCACDTGFVYNCPSGNVVGHTGRANWINNSLTQNPVVYRYMENLFGNLWHLLPDVLFVDRQMYALNNISEYVYGELTESHKPIGDVNVEQNSNGSKSDDTGVNYWVKELSTDYFLKGITIGASYDMQYNSKKGFGAYYYMKNGIVNIANGGGFDHLYRCNMLTNRAQISSPSKWYLYGSRLIYKNI